MTNVHLERFLTLARIKRTLPRSHARPRIQRVRKRAAPSRTSSIHLGIGSLVVRAYAFAITWVNAVLRPSVGSCIFVLCPMIRVTYVDRSIQRASTRALPTDQVWWMSMLQVPPRIFRTHSFWMTMLRHCLIPLLQQFGTHSLLHGMAFTFPGCFCWGEGSSFR